MTEVLLITGLVVALFFLFFIRPTRIEERRRQRDLNELQVGDTVLTRGGLIAQITGVETPESGPMLIRLRLADEVEVLARTGAIAERIDAIAGWSDEEVVAALSDAEAEIERRSD